MRQPTVVIIALACTGLCVATGCDMVLDFGAPTAEGDEVAGSNASTSDGSSSAQGTGGFGGEQAASSGSGQGGQGGSSFTNPTTCEVKPKVIWSRRMGGDKFEDLTSLVPDAKGNTYVTGYTESSTFYASETVAHAGAGDTYVDMFLAKVSNDGEVLWSRLLGTTTSVCAKTYRQRGHGVAVLSDDSVVVTGRFDCTLDFSAGNSPCTEPNGCLTSHGATTLGPPSLIQPDAFIARVGATGDVLWARSLGDKFWQAGWDVASSPLGDIYMIGRYEGTLDLGDEVSLPTAALGAASGFLLKLDADGKPQWAKDLPSVCTSATTNSCKVATDAEGNLYWMGDYASGVTAVDFGEGPLDCQCQATSVVGMIASDGTPQWTRCSGICENDEALIEILDVSASPDGERIFLGGRTKGSVDFGDGVFHTADGYDAFVNAFDKNGVPVGNYIFGLQRDQEAFGVGANPFGGVVVAGRFRGALDLGNCYIEQADAINPLADAFVVGLDSDLVPTWGFAYGNGTGQSLKRAAVNDTGEVFVGGSYSGTVDLGNGPLLNRSSDPTVDDVLIARLALPEP